MRSPPTHACRRSIWAFHETGAVRRISVKLIVNDLHTYYGDSHVLQGVSLEVASGTVVAVLGRNGVGKTTLCRSIVGFTPARAGRVVFDEVEITRVAPHRICGMHLGLVPQGRRVFPSLTVYEHLAIAESRCRESFF